MSFINRSMELRLPPRTLEAQCLGVQRRLRAHRLPPIELPVGVIEMLLLAVTAALTEVLFGCLLTGRL